MSEPFKVEWKPGELLTVSDQNNVWFAEMWNGSTKFGDLAPNESVIYLGEHKISKRRQRTMIKILTARGTAWIDPRAFTGEK